MAESAELKVDDLSTLKVADLKRELKERSLLVSGNKTELIERLQAHLQGHSDELAIEDTSIGLGDDGPADDNDSDIEMGGDDALLQEEKTEILETPEAELDILEESVKPQTKPLIQKITMSDKEEKENGIEAKTVSLSPEEKKKQRAERFGVQSEDGKKQSRAERFGFPTKAPSSTGSKTGAIAHTPITADDIDKLKKRAERFGTVVSTSLSKVEDVEKLKQRAERFGSVVSPSLSKAEDAGKLKQRAERFGAVVSPTLSKVEEQERILKRKERFGALAGGLDSGKVLSSDEIEAKKRKRAERFTLS